MGVDMMELLVSEAQGGEGAVTQVIRPAAIVPEDASRRIMMELALRDVRDGGHWLTEPNVWRRFDRPYGQDVDPGLVGSIQVAYGTPTRYEITLYRVTVTNLGATMGWTVQTLCDEALELGGMTLAECPRAELTPPPRPFPSARG